MKNKKLIIIIVIIAIVLFILCSIGFVWFAQIIMSTDISDSTSQYITGNQAIGIAKKSNQYSQYVNKIRSQFHKVLDFQITNETYSSNSPNFYVEISGTCSGYTDIYNTKINKSTFTITIYVLGDGRIYDDLCKLKTNLMY